MGIVEITRLCLPCRLGRARRLATRNRLISAMVDHAAATGIMSLTGVVSASFLAQVMAMGWHSERLGPPRLCTGATRAAFRIDLDADTPERLATTGLYTPGTPVPPFAPRAGKGRGGEESGRSRK